MSPLPPKIRTLLDQAWAPVVFWLAFFLVPIAARMYRGEGFITSELIVGVGLSALLFLVGRFFGRFSLFYYWLACLILTLGSAIVVTNTFSVGGTTTGYAALALLDTTSTEAAEFLRFSIRPEAFVFAAFLLLPLLTLLFFRRRLTQTELPRPMLYALVALALLPVPLALWKAARAGPALTAADAPKQSIYPVAQYVPLQPFLAFATVLADIHADSLVPEAHAVKVPGVQPLDGAPRTYVVILGESLSRHHMQLYGYPKPTTPLLAKRAKDLYAFQDVITAHAHTVPAVHKLLALPGEAQGTLLDVLNGASFATFWLSNQPRFGAWETEISRLVVAATHKMWVNGDAGGQWADQEKHLDEALLPAFDQALRDPAPQKFLFVHLLGNHGDYAKRYPLEFERFQPVTRTSPRTGERQAKIVSEYDNSILYNDFLIDALLQRVADLHQQAFVLYLSDHGDEVYDFRDMQGHSDGNISAYMADIPFLVWLSPEYRAARPELVAELPGDVTRPYQTDRFLYSVLDLAGVQWPGMRPDASVFSPQFREVPRFIGGLTYEAIRERSVRKE